MSPHVTAESLAEGNQIDVRWMSNQFLTRRQHASHYIITPGSKTSNKKNNTKQILMIYIHFFDNDILTFHYTTPFSNYESL
jgi:Mg2+ and Co2+ transporter CorA